MAPRALSLALGLCFVTGRATSEGLEGPNPIRRVSALLEGMQKKIVEEAKKEEGLHDKFLCHCKKTSKELQASIAKREREIPTLAADLKAAEEQKVQIEGDLTKGKDERKQAYKAISDATAIREKEAAAFAKDKAEQEKTIEAIVKAVAALREGMGQKSFLQSQQAQQLRAMRELRQLASATGIDEDSRVQLLAFLEGGASYSPQSGEIVGILEQMGEQMRADLKKSMATESAGIESFGNLTAAKKKEIKALDDAIESKTQRVGDLAMDIARMKQEMGEGPRLLEEDKRMLNDLTQDCTKGKAEYDCRVKTRAEEQTALSEVLHTLTNDDALGTFKKALKPAAPVSFLQVSMGSRARAAAAMMKARALSFVDSLRGKDQAHAVQLNLLAAALQGQGSFDKVVVMIDEFIQTLKTEQKEDDSKKDYCNTKIFEAGQKSSDLSRDLSDKDTGITSAQQGLQAVVEDLQGLQASLVKMDKEVAQATDLRKAENADYTGLVAGNNQARDLLSLASKRLRQFYAPNSTVSFLQEIDVAPVANATNAAAVRGACIYQKAHGEAQGVLGLLDQLSHDLEVESLQAKLQEENAQKGFEKLVADASEKRTAVTQSLTQRNTAKADLETNLQLLQDGKTATGRELTAHGKVTALLHKDCDFLLAQYSTRQDARNTEIEALRNAKTILLSAESTTRTVATTTASAAARTTAAPATTAAATTVAPTAVADKTTAALETTAVATTVAPTTVASTTTVAPTTVADTTTVATTAAALETTAVATTVAPTTVASTTTVATTTAAADTTAAATTVAPTTAAATTVTPTTVADTTTVATTAAAADTTAAATTVTPTTVADTTTVATTTAAAAGTTAVETTTTTAARQQRKKSAPPPTPPPQTETFSAKAKNTDEGFFFAQLR